MPARGRGLVVAAAVVLGAAGCADPAVDAAVSAPPPPATATTAAATPTTETVSPATAMPDATPTTEEPVQKLYRMDDSYSFVPIDGTGAAAHVVLLTFDDGPKEAPLLRSMLDTLDAHRAKAVFFVNGYRAESQPELLQLIAARGHAIGNHSWDHVNLAEQSAAEVEQQIGDVQTLVTQTVGTPPRFFRPPFGSGDASVKQIAAGHGLTYMTWSNGSLDWDSSTTDRPDLVVENVLAQLHPGANILMHELPRTAQALDSLLSQLTQRGYGFIDPATIE